MSACDVDLRVMSACDVEIVPGRGRSRPAHTDTAAAPTLSHAAFDGHLATAGDAYEPDTVTTPVIVGCNVQKYRYTPGAPNVYEYC